MTFTSRLMSFFPALHLSLIGMMLVATCYYHSVVYFIVLLTIIYLFPILCYHLHQFIYPLRHGMTDIAKPSYSPWWGTHQLQAVFTAIPTFEALLRIIPGFYSMWLRLWGSKIGKGVHWTPRMKITDRQLLEIGNGVIFGDKITCYSHVVLPKEKKLLLYIKPVKIAAGAFIGAGSRLGPGTRIDEKVILPILTDLRVNEHIKCEPGKSLH